MYRSKDVTCLTVLRFLCHTALNFVTNQSNQKSLESEDIFIKVYESTHSDLFRLMLKQTIVFKKKKKKKKKKIIKRRRRREGEEEETLQHRDVYGALSSLYVVVIYENKLKKQLPFDICQENNVFPLYHSFMLSSNHRQLHIMHILFTHDKNPTSVWCIFRPKNIFVKRQQHLSHSCQ